jgi:hypothetical protein
VAREKPGGAELRLYLCENLVRPVGGWEVTRYAGPGGAKEVEEDKEVYVAKMVFAC